jgi:hypothetical protein
MEGDKLGVWGRHCNLVRQVNLKTKKIKNKKLMFYHDLVNMARSFLQLSPSHADSVAMVWRSARSGVAV